MKVHNVIASLVISIVCLTLVAAAQQQPDVTILFQQLQSPQTQDQATRMLLARGASDPSVREYLVKKLPNVITDPDGKSGQAWSSAVRLAGGLKIVEAAPALTKWAGKDEVGDTSIGVFLRLQNDPAGAALVQIGDPAVPAIVTALESAPPGQRLKLYLALGLIDSPQAKNAVADHLNREDDPRCSAALAQITRHGLKSAP